MNSYKCIMDGCTGTMTESVRGYVKCNKCSVKVKESVAAQQNGVQVAQPVPATPAQPPVPKPAPVANKPAQQPQAPKTPKAEQADKPKRTPTQKVTTKDGVTLVGKTTTIKCKDCGAERTVKVQDVFQVTRCVDCQKKHAKAKRNTRLKEKRATKEG